MKKVYTLVTLFIVNCLFFSAGLAQQGEQNDYLNAPLRNSHAAMTQKKVTIDVSALRQATTRPAQSRSRSLPRTTDKAGTPLGQVAAQPSVRLSKAEPARVHQTNKAHKQTTHKKSTQTKPVAKRSSSSGKQAVSGSRYHWQPEKAQNGPVTVVVSLADQQAHIYRNGIRIGKSVVSTGKRGYETPTGEFTILQKKKRHVSNIYGAKMPYMQRLTWGGIALHGGRVPDYPASHGCIRFPHKFARLLYSVTNFDDTRVVVTAQSHPDVEMLTSL